MKNFGEEGLASKAGPRIDTSPPPQAGSELSPMPDVIHVEIADVALSGICKGLYNFEGPARGYVGRLIFDPGV